MGRDEWIVVAAVVTAIISTARLTRLVTHDRYPPAMALRRWWWNQTVAKGGWRAHWNLVLVGDEPGDSGCPFCAAPWIMLAVGLWGWLSGPDAVWWGFNGWMAASYLASMVVVRDEPPEE